MRKRTLVEDDSPRRTRPPFFSPASTKLAAVPLLAATLLLAFPAHAGPPSTNAASRTNHLALLGTTATLNLGLIVAGKWLAPASCNWCDANRLNRFDSGARQLLRWQRPTRAHMWSNVSAFALVPAFALGLSSLQSHRGGASQGEVLDDLIRVGNAASLTLLVNQVTKYAFARQRPFARATDLDPTSVVPYARNRDENLSFFSGHTALTFAVATSGSILATRRLGHASAWVWAGSLAAASSVGWLRIAADKHYATDVLTGAILGTAIGIAMTVPNFASKRGANMPLASAVGRFGVSFGGRF